MIYELTSLKIKVLARSPLISYDSIFLTLWIKNWKTSCEFKEYQKDSRIRGNCLLPLLSPKININHSSLSHPLQRTVSANSTQLSQQRLPSDLQQTMHRMPF